MNAERPTLFTRLKALFERSSLFRICWELIGVTIMLTIILIPRYPQICGTDCWPQIIHSLYLALGKYFFVLGLALTILPSLLGIKSLVRSTMDTYLFNVISKISYCTYLVHGLVIFWFYDGITYDLYFSNENMWAYFFCFLLLSLGFGFLLTILVEVPFSKLEKQFFSHFKINTKNI